MLCGSDGYPDQASVYCEKSDRPESRNLGENAVLEFTKLIPDIFTSYSLLHQLKELGIRATGTVREGRLGTKRHLFAVITVALLKVVYLMC